MAVAGLVVASRLQVGDLDAGAPELRADSRYNLDNAYLTSHYATSSDVMAIMVKTPPDQCVNYETLVKVRDLQILLGQLPGVEATNSFANLARQMTSAYSEGSQGRLFPSEVPTPLLSLSGTEVKERLRSLVKRFSVSLTSIRLLCV